MYFKFMLIVSLFLSVISSQVKADPGDILTQFSINNVSGDGRNPSTPQGISYHNGYLWVLDFGTDRIYRVYPETVYDEDDVTVLFNAGDSDLNIPLPDVANPPINSDGNPVGSCFDDEQGKPQYCGGGGLTLAENYLWNASAVTDDIIKIDPVDGDNLESENALANLAFPSPTDMAYDGRHFWIVDWQTNTITEVLPEDGSILSVISGPSRLPSYVDNSSATNARPFGATWDGRALWISEQQEDKIYRVDPTSGALLSYFDSPGSNPKGLAWDGDALWHVDQSANTIYKLDAGIIPIGLVGCLEKNGRGFSGEVLLSQASVPDQTMVSDRDGCFIFDSFTSGVPLEVVMSEIVVDAKPIISLVETAPGETEVTLIVGEQYSEPGYSAIDVEDGDITFDVVATPDVIHAPGVINTSSPGTYTVAYDVVDSAGNLADTMYRTVNVLVIDTTPPVISLLGDNPFYVEQNGQYVEPGATAIDDRDGDISAGILVSENVNVSASGSYIVSYDVSDSTGNAAVTVTRNVIVRDTIPPVITLLGDDPLSHEKGVAFDDPGVLAIDNVDGDISASVAPLGSVPAAVGSYVLVYSAIDSSGNSSNVVTRTINVIDTTAPVVTLLGDSPMDIERGEEFIDPGALAIDSPAENISTKIVVSGTVDTSELGAYSLNYDVTDDSGNVASTVTRTVNVVNSGPVITLIGASPYIHNINTPYIDLGATAFDSEDGDLTASIVASNNVNITALGMYSVTYNVTDSGDLPAPSVVRVVEVRDSTPPVITLVGSATVNVEQGSSYTDPGATAIDNLDGNITGRILQEGTVNVNLGGRYVLTYHVSDSSGNAAKAVSRTVIVTDTTPPTLSLNGASVVDHEAGYPFVDPGATANDLHFGDISAQVQVSGTVNVNSVGTYTLVYSIVDGGGNTAPDVTRTVVVSDTEAPNLTLNGFTTIDHPQALPFVDPGATAIDVNEGDISRRVVVSGSVDASRPGSYTLTYSVADTTGNTAPSVTRNVVVSDTVAPRLLLVGAQNMTVVSGTLFEDPGVNATDNVDGNISESVFVSGSVVMDAAGTYELVYRISDAAGNVANPVSRTVTVVSPSRLLIQAETGRIVGGTSVSRNASGYTGSGYLETSGRQTSIGDYFEYRIEGLYATPYALTLRFSGRDAGMFEARMNGVPAGTFRLDSTGSNSIWDRSHILNVLPQEGVNILRLVVLNKDSNIDRIHIRPLQR